MGWAVLSFLWLWKISWFERFPDEEAYSGAAQNASQNRWSSQIWLLASLVFCMHDGQALCPHATCLSQCCVCNQVRLTWDALHDMTRKWQRAMPWLRPISAAYPVQSVFGLEFWEEAVEPPVHEATVTQGSVRWCCVALQREWAFADWAYLSFQALLWKLHSFRWYFHILFHGMMSSPKFPLTLGDFLMKKLIQMLCKTPLKIGDRPKYGFRSVHRVCLLH